MAQFPMRNHGAGPPNLAKSSRQDTRMARPERGPPRGTPCRAAVAKRPGWQIILATFICFIARPVTCNEGSSATSYQNPSGITHTASPLQPDLPASQGVTRGMLLEPSQHLTNAVVKGQTGSRAAGERPCTRCSWADSVGPTDQLSLPEARLNDPSLISTSLHYASGAAKEEKNDADLDTLRLNVSLAPDALAEVTGFPKGLQASSKGGFLLSLPHASKADVGSLDSNSSAAVPATLSQAQSLWTHAGLLQPGPLPSAPKASAQPLQASPDATSVARLSDNSVKQPAAADSLPSEAGDLHATTRSATPMVPIASLEHRDTKTGPAGVLLKPLPSAPQAYRASSGPSYLTTSTSVSSALPVGSAVMPTQSDLTAHTNTPESTSYLQATSSGPGELITSGWPGSYLLASGEAARVKLAQLGSVHGTLPRPLTQAPRSRESSLDTSPQGLSSSATTPTWSAPPASIAQSTDLLPAPGPVAKLLSSKPIASTSTPEPLHVADLDGITDHPSPGPLSIVGPTEKVEREMLTAGAPLGLAPSVSESGSQPPLPRHVGPDPQSPPPLGASASPQTGTLVNVSSAGVLSASPSRGHGGTALPAAQSGARGISPGRPSGPKLATPGLGHLLVLTPTSAGLSDPAEFGRSSALMLETTAPEASSVLPRVPPRPVTRRHALTNAAVSDVSPFTGSVTEGPPLVVAGIGHSAATRPLDRLKLVLAASASSTGTSLEEHVSEMVHTGSTSCPTWDPAAVEQKGSPGSAVRHAHGYLIPSPWEPIRATSGLEALVGGTTRALTYSAVLTGVKPPIGTFTDTTTYSPPHELPTSQGISTQSSTAACCPVTSSSVSRARTAARLTSAALHEASAKRGMLPAQEETDVVAKVPPGSSELPLAASSTAPTTELLSHSTWAKPPAQLARKHYSLRRLGMRRKLSTPARLVLSPSTTPLPSRTAGQPGPKAPTSPQNKTLPVLSSERSKARSDLMETNASCATPLYPNRTGLALLAEPTPVGKEHTPAAGLGSGVPVSSTAASSKWKPTSAVLGEYKVLDKSTKASDFSGLASAEPPSSATPSEWISTSTAVSKATPVKTRAAVSMPLPPAQRTTTQPSGPQPPVFQPPTEAKPTVVSSHHVATRSPAPKTTAWLTSARTPVAPDPWLPTAPKQTRLVPWNKTTVPTLFRHPTTISSKHLPLSPQRTSTAPTGIHVLTRTRAAKPNLTTAVTSKGVAPTKTAHASKQMLPESRVPKQNFSSTQGTGSASSPTSPAQQLSVRILPLRFRLLRIAYSVLLKDKSSQAYQKLEKEVTLMLNKMFSSYQNFLKANIVQFLNGSAIVVSEVLFQGDRPTPTSSDLIRTVITEVERQMDAFFDWRVDVTSVQSNGFSLENLEPEKLLVSFTALRLGWIVTAGGVGSQGPLQRLNDAVVQSLGTLYKVKNFSIIKLRDLRGDLEISGEAYVDTQAHADISQVLQALRGLVNYSVDLTMLSVDDARLNLQVFPISFLINNRVLSEKLLDRSSVEHQNLTRDLDDVLTHALRKYQSFLQVIIRELLGGSLICRGDVVFQHPAPSPADVLQALVLSVGPGDALAKSGFRVDPYSFTVAGDQVEPPSVYRFPGYGVAIIVLCGLVMITLLVLALLYLNSGLFGWRGKAIIQGGRDPEVGMQTFELENQGFHSTIEEEGGRQAYTPTKHSAGE